AGEELDSINLYKLMMVYEKAINRYENHTADARHTVEKYPYTIEQQKAIIASLVTINKRMDFRSVVTHSDNKVHYVYNFLAMLEMLQQQLLEIHIGLGFNNFWVAEKE